MAYAHTIHRGDSLTIRQPLTFADGEAPDAATLYIAKGPAFETALATVTGVVEPGATATAATWSFTLTRAQTLALPTGDGRLFIRTEKAGVSRDTPVDDAILIKPAPPGTA